MTKGALKTRSRVTVYSRHFFPSVGGVENSSRLMARELAVAGYETCVVTLTPNHGNDGNDGNEVDEGLYSVRRCSGFWSVAAGLYRSDLVVIKGGVSLVAGLLCLALRRQYMIYHEMSEPMLAFNSGFIARLRNWCIRLVAQKASHHIAVGVHCLLTRKLDTSARTTVLHPPVYVPPDDVSRVCTSEYDVLFVGRLVATKGVLTLADALCKFEQSRTLLRVAVVGHGPLSDELALRLSTFRYVKVTLTGALTSQQVAWYYRSTKLLVVPSIAIEGFPMVIAEAISAHVPVVGSNQAPIIEAMGEAGIPFRCGNSDELHAAIARALNDPLLYAGMKKAAEVQAGRFAPSEYRVRLRRLIAESP